MSITKYTYFTYIEILQKLLTKDGFDFVASVIKTLLQFIFSHNGGHYTRNNLIEHFKMKRILIFDHYMQLYIQTDFNYIAIKNFLSTFGKRVTTIPRIIVYVSPTSLSGLIGLMGNIIYLIGEFTCNAECWSKSNGRHVCSYLSYLYIDWNIHYNAIQFNCIICA